MAAYAPQAPHVAALRRSPIVQPGYRAGERPGNYGRKLPAEPLSNEEMVRLLAHLGRGPCGYRNRALVALMWRAGLRIAEALALQSKDIDREVGTVTVLSGKGGKRRTVAIDALALNLIEQWESVRAGLGINGQAPLFCCCDIRTRGKAMYSSYVRDRLKRAAREAGILKRVHPHGLRHTMAFELLMEGQPLGVIRDQLGHSELGTTMRYLDHLAPAVAIRAMHARPVPEIGSIIPGAPSRGGARNARTRSQHAGAGHPAGAGRAKAWREG